ncbi:hypothetical protein IW262DRAFT_1496341, partial [Armillaria fumosa]
FTTDITTTPPRCSSTHTGDTHDHCLQVVVTPPIIFIVRSRSHHPRRCPAHRKRIATHGYGCWVDDTSTTPPSTLICSESEHPWSWELNSLELYSRSFSPLVSKILPRRGAFQRTDVILGERAATRWILPHDRAIVSHWRSTTAARSTLKLSSPRSRSVHNQTALDYNEDLARIALWPGLGWSGLLSCGRNICSLRV